MKLVTLNVNGIRSALSKGLAAWIVENDIDILCLQEIKLFETELVEPIFKELGYACAWFPAQKKGYSGVAIISKKSAKSVEYGCGIETYDFEGRSILAHFEGFSVLCAYFPSGTTGDVRQSVKMSFLTDIHAYVLDVQKRVDCLIVCGDVNICHKEIDIHNPKANAKTSGFLPEERAWVDDFVASGYTDCFREIDPSPHQYTWWSLRSGARDRNLGWRIDYVFVNEKHKNTIKTSKLHPEARFSDHCAVEVNFDLNF
ncbi:MAG: exodeoxyribonuclease III [Leadbetterella sp.]